MDFLQVKVLWCLMWFYICQKPLGNSARLCEAGNKLDSDGNCVPCPHYQYQSEPNQRLVCTNCRTCAKETGSELISKCTRTTNAVCQCREGFVPIANDHSSCKCPMGFELNKTGKKCLSCGKGYFNADDAGKKCKPWTNCGTRGVKIPGSDKSDVRCADNPGNPLKSNTQDPDSTSVHGRERTITTFAAVHPTTSPLTPTIPSSSPSITPSTSTSTLSLSKSTRPIENSGFPGYAIACPPVLLLILLSPVIFKQIIVPFIQYNKKKADTPCRRPVEESGDSSHSSLVKSCQGQP